MKEKILVKKKILIVDAEPLIRWSLAKTLQGWGYETVEAATIATAREAVDTEDPAAVLLDITLPDESGLDMLREIKERSPETIVIMITGNVDVGTAVNSFRAAADDFITKPIDFNYLEELLRRSLPAGPSPAARQQSPTMESPRSPSRPQPPTGLDEIVGKSPAKDSIIKFIRQAAAAGKTSVLLQGESGTGKELVARAIHSTSSRAAHPFVAINCGALNPNLMGSELFGHEKGAFTGAVARRSGAFERADGGTLLLDEIGDLPPEGQVTLLRVLQERRFERVGGEKTIAVDVRVIATTNRDLKTEVAQGRFREDLYFRLSVMPFVLPPLRERGEDVLLLAEHFITTLGAQVSKATRSLTPEARDALMKHPWRGNVRELRNVIESALALENSDQITLEKSLMLDPTPAKAPSKETEADTEQTYTVGEGGTLLPEGVKFDNLALTVKRQLVEQAVTLSNGNMKAAAKLLKLSRFQLTRRIKSLGMEKKKSVRARN
jgi:DNA-binding NtrC family response regulator